MESWRHSCKVANQYEYDTMMIKYISQVIILVI
jgi:hypothetical protein